MINDLHAALGLLKILDVLFHLISLTLTNRTHIALDLREGRGHYFH